ncbi:MAG: GNAT family N-acetyltransferase [Burkholderiales bacterium]|nr:GNAT family N-acetyltransferase [Burkholderiales bacterium]
MLIEPATLADARRVAQVHVQAWRAAYVGIVPDAYLASLSVDKRETMWREAIEKQLPELLLARVDSDVAGWVAFDASRDKDAAPGSGEIWALYVDPAHWAGGIGRALLQRARARLNERGFGRVSLWVLAENTRALRFYGAAGFTLDAGSGLQFELGGRKVQELRYALAAPGAVADATP